MTENDERAQGNGNGNDYFDGLIGAYVIDSLDERERDLMDDYLADNPAQQDEVRRLTQAFDELIVAQAGGARYPGHLWERIEARLPDEGKVPTLRALPVSTSAEPDDLSARRASRSRRLEPTGRRLVFVAAAAIIVVMLAGLVVRQIATSSSSSPPTLSAYDLPREADRAAAQPGSRSGSLLGENGAVDVRVVVESSGRTYMVPNRLPPVDQAHAYQLWSLDSGQPVSLGVMTGPATMDLPAGVRPSRLALSVEPSGGSPQPTTTPVAAGALA